MRYPSSTSCFKFGISFYWLNSIGTKTRPKQIVSWLQISPSMQVECLFKKTKKGVCFATSRPLDAWLTSLPGLGWCPVRQQNHQRDLPQPQPDRWRGNEGLVGGASRGLVVWEWMDPGTQWKWWEVCDRIWSEVLLLNLEPFQGLMGFWTVCLSTWFRICSWIWKGW